MSFHDDIWMGFSVIPMLVRLGLVHMVLVYGTNAVDEEELLLLSPLDIERRELGSHLVLVSRIAYAAL